MTNWCTCVLQLHNHISIYNNWLLILFSDCSSKDELDMFIVESVIMKKFKHKNILNLVGVSYGVENGITRPYIILPFMVNRDLKTYL